MIFLNPNEKERYVELLPEMNLIRTGAVSDGNCFFYSMNMVMKDFRELSEEKKANFVLQQRQWLADQMTLNDWLDIQNGQFALLQISQLFRIVFWLLHHGDRVQTLTTTELPLPSDFLEDDNTFVQFLASFGKRWQEFFQQWETYQHGLLALWKWVFSFDYLDSSFISDWVNACPSTFDDDTQSDDIWKSFVTCAIQLISAHIRQVFEEHNAQYGDDPDESIDKEDETILHDKLVEFWQDLFVACRQETFYYQKMRLTQPFAWVDIEMVMAMSPYLPYDIMFIDAEKHQLYADTQYWTRKNSSHHRHVLLLLYFPDLHFENIGQLVSSTDQKPKIIRIFEPQHPVVQYLRHLSSS